LCCISFVICTAINIKKLEIKRKEEGKNKKKRSEKKGLCCDLLQVSILCAQVCGVLNSNAGALPFGWCSQEAGGVAGVLSTGLLTVTSSSIKLLVS